MPGVPSTTAATDAGGNAQVTDQQLQDTQNKSINDMMRMTQMQMEFNMQMNRAKAAHSAAQANTING